MKEIFQGHDGFISRLTLARRDMFNYKTKARNNIDILNKIENNIEKLDQAIEQVIEFGTSFQYRPENMKTIKKSNELRDVLRYLLDQDKRVDIDPTSSHVDIAKQLGMNIENNNNEFEGHNNSLESIDTNNMLYTFTEDFPLTPVREDGNISGTFSNNNHNNTHAVKPINHISFENTTDITKTQPQQRVRGKGYHKEYLDCIENFEYSSVEDEDSDNDTDDSDVLSKSLLGSLSPGEQFTNPISPSLNMSMFSTCSIDSKEYKKDIHESIKERNHRQHAAHVRHERRIRKQKRSNEPIAVRTNSISFRIRTYLIYFLLFHQKVSHKTQVVKFSKFINENVVDKLLSDPVFKKIVSGDKKLLYSQCQGPIQVLLKGYEDQYGNSKFRGYNRPNFLYNELQQIYNKKYEDLEIPRRPSQFYVPNFRRIPELEVKSGIPKRKRKRGGKDAVEIILKNQRMKKDENNNYDSDFNGDTDDSCDINNEDFTNVAV